MVNDTYDTHLSEKTYCVILVNPRIATQLEILVWYIV
jgi:hypothetical protein